VAGSSQTDLYRMLPRGVKPELVVEGGHPIDFALGQP